ncbi:MAG: NifU family protein, partial [Candidatus Rokubacteria bacterium]|nr:NifU family protein [Candidatus Rokubacteria bacterium]
GSGEHAALGDAKHSTGPAGGRPALRGRPPGPAAAPRRDDLGYNEPELKEGTMSDDLKTKVQELLDSGINPAVAGHGGYIELLDVKENTAYIRMSGGCQGCGMADVTLKAGIERMIFEEIPEITQVLDVTDHAAGSNPYYSPSKA